MPIENELIQNVLEHSLNDFFAAEGESIASGVSERNCCARLAMHMQQHANSAGLEGYFADAEYDRKQGGQIKTILNDKMEEIVIISDLILHSRGANVAEDNLIAVEMKKTGRPKHEKLSDQNRLRAMTKSSYDSIWSNDGVTHPEHVCGYRLGVFIELNAAKRIAYIEYFRSGESIGFTTKGF